MYIKSTHINRSYLLQIMKDEWCMSECYYIKVMKDECICKTNVKF
jgi:hypothetical protein